MLQPGNTPRLGPRARVMVATPTYTGELVVPYVESYAASLLFCLVNKVELELRVVKGASLIQYARNQLIREFLEGDYTHLMWIDADVGFDPRAIVKLIGHGKDVVGGVYPMKCVPIEWPYEPLPGEQTTSLHRAKILPGGFMLCTRKAVQKVADAAPWYWHYMGGMRYKTAHVMDLTLEDNTLLGEDVILCRKFQQAGFDVWVDPDIAFSHTGKFEWRGNLAVSIEQGPQQGKLQHHQVQRLRLEDDPHKRTEVIDEMFKAWGNTWSAPPAELLALSTLAQKATRILETGCGLSTIVMAASNPNAHVHCLENDSEWCKRLLDECRALGLDNVTVHLTPLNPSNWFYDIPADLPESFDLALHDGPPFLDGTHLVRTTDPRLPFYELLADRIRDAVLVIDDIESFKDQAANYRHEIVGERFAICMPNVRKSEAA